VNALERILAWPEMMRSPQLAKFLDYIVRRTLDGEEQAIKAYSIAVDVFGRSPDFDPQSDPIVRVQARRLRALLNSYYDANGDSEPLQIRLPTGRYIPEFVVINPAALEVSPAAPPTIPSEPQVQLPLARRLNWWMIALSLLLATALLAFSLTRLGPSPPAPGAAIHTPSITILEFAGPASTGGNAPLVSGLAIELVTDLEQFENIDVRYGGTGPHTDDPPSDFLLTGAVQPNGELVNYTITLTTASSPTPVWSRTITVASEDAHSPAVLDQLSRSFSMVLGSPRGPVHAGARARALSQSSLPDAPSVYFCRVLFDLYRERGRSADAQRVGDCLARLREQERASPTALAIGASVAAESVSALADESARSQIYQQALRDLDLALQATPVSSFVWEQRARLQETEGDQAMARTNYSSALQLNPANSDAMAASGRLLAFQGAIEEARPLVLDALAAPEPPAWYHGGPAVLALLDQDFVGASELAERYATADGQIGPVLALVAAQNAGRAELVAQHLPQLVELPAFRQRGILPRLRETISNPPLLEMIATGIVAAGVPPTALEQPF
jgi:Tfp pilus assembly protein PilF/TolB-like protein